MHGTEEASKDGRVRVRILHGLNISHKELTYLLQKSTSHQKPSTMRMLQGDRLVGKDHRSSPTTTHKERNQRTPHASICHTAVTIRACYGTCKPQHKYFSISQLLN